MDLSREIAKYLSPLPQPLMLSLIDQMPNDVRALATLRHNITRLLEIHKGSQTELAHWLQHGPSWINKFLNGERQIQLKDLDRIAQFFGLAPYQLFQPGISQLTERRTHQRRKHADRRIGSQARYAQDMAAHVNPRRPRASPADAMQEMASLAIQVNEMAQRLADMQNTINQPAKKRPDTKAG